ncbi:MAG: bifunctional DNA primase/polymerase [Meiothermus sp.]|nr:bifunctional DNA primase/polymerase [Meiothermus sp.]
MSVLHSNLSTREAALFYASLGLPVLPLKGKQPASRFAPNGKDSASLDYETISMWFAHSKHNLGAVPPMWVLVIDVDDPEALPELLRLYPELETAPHALTGGGGSHFWTRLPEGVSLAATVRALPSVDLRGLGKTYLVMPPSTHPQTGRPYEWVQPLVSLEALPLAPQSLLERLTPAPRPTQPYTPGTAPQAAQSRLEGLLTWACDKVASAPEGTRHDTLLRHSRLVGGWVGAVQGLNEGEALERLIAAGIAAGLPRSEAVQTARDGLADGIKSPLPLPESDSDLGPSWGFGANSIASKEEVSRTKQSDWVQQKPDSKGWGAESPWTTRKGGW